MNYSRMIIEQTKKKLNNNNDLLISVKNDLNREERETENVGIHEE